MFDWLEQELEEIKSQKFHLTNQRPSDGWIAIQVAWPVPPPTAYREFLERFGSVRLYRDGRCHMIQVFDQPFLESDTKGTEYLVFGNYDTNSAAFKKDLLEQTGDSPVFEERNCAGTFREIGAFPEWLDKRRTSARKSYTKKEWKEICGGPEPFSPREEEIVRARSQYTWKRTGITAEGTISLEMTNGSTTTIPYLSVGVRAPRLLGAIRVAVGGIPPGETGTLLVDAYKDFVDAEEVELYQLEDPCPEERADYWEFSKPE